MNRLGTPHMVQILRDLQVNHPPPTSYWSVASFPPNSRCGSFFYPRLGDSDILAPASSPGSPLVATNPLLRDGCRAQASWYTS